MLLVQSLPKHLIEPRLAYSHTHCSIARKLIPTQRLYSKFFGVGFSFFFFQVRVFSPNHMCIANTQLTRWWEGCLITIGTMTNTFIQEQLAIGCLVQVLAPIACALLTRLYKCS